jgi:hypothetical protein
MHVGEIELAPRERCPGHARAVGIVRDDEHAIAREVHVRLECVDADLDRAFERDHRVFRTLGGGTAVCVEPPRMH